MILAIVTMELRNVLKHEDFELFDFNYEISDSDWKNDLEQLIVRHFYFEEIGVESIDRFKFLFQTKMTQIMPYYDKLYKTTLYDHNPLTTRSLSETINSENKGTQTVENDSDGNSKTSDYPQNLNPSQDILSSQTADKTESTQKRTDDLNNQLERLEEGYDRVPYPELLEKHRSTILRINSMILRELKELFILVY